MLNKKYIKIKIFNFLNSFLRKFDTEIVFSKKKIDYSAYNFTKRPEKPVYLNIGAGKWSHPIWHNLDNPFEGYDKSFGYKSEWKYLIKHDLMKRNQIPVKSNTLEAVYVSHVIEHLNDETNDFLFREVYRMLKPGGFFRIVAPDLNFFYRIYKKKDSELLSYFSGLQYKNYSNEQHILAMFAGSLSKLYPDHGVKKVSSKEFKSLYAKYGIEKTLNKLNKRVSSKIISSHPQFHASWHTEKKLIKNLKLVNFSEVYPSRYLQSGCKVMRDPNFFDYMHADCSLFVESIK